MRIENFNKIVVISSVTKKFLRVEISIRSISTIHLCCIINQ